MSAIAAASAGRPGVNAVRAYAVEGHPPGAVLELVNRFMRTVLPAESATLCLLTLEPETGRVRLASAGHLPPLLQVAGRAEFLALLISWLRGLGPRVIDPPGGNSLLGQSVGQWSERRLAQDCGLQPHPVFAVSRVKRAPWRGDSPSGLSGMRPVDDLACPLIVGSEVFGTPPEVRNACLRLAGKLGVDTLRIALAPGEEGWRFVECDRLPELTEGPALRALADLAEARSA